MFKIEVLAIITVAYLAERHTTTYQDKENVFIRGDKVLLLRCYKHDRVVL